MATKSKSTKSESTKSENANVCVVVRTFNRKGGFATSELDYCEPVKDALKKCVYTAPLCDDEPPRVVVKIGTQIRDGLVKEVVNDVIGNNGYNLTEEESKVPEEDDNST